ncbi:hypothetical protein E1193_03885 [Micromonospora sp. KC606]|uniref:hypothetical protein n=1 Tax=Micromonospora sp. KC606 TaxID=2530379 RepID=UPI00104409A7|nr:hypothetical protein [Micromonospora sp. KC606]TDC85058.1 hypothetical protein E1193_03885 [Micromonospora sp. KC606]
MQMRRFFCVPAGAALGVAAVLGVLLGQPAAAAAPTPVSSDRSAATTTGIALRGMVQQVSLSCKVLRTDWGSYALLGGDPAVVRPGAWVEVHGNLHIGATVCAYGAQLQVTDALPM